MGAGVIHAADLTLEDAPPGFAWIVGAFYVIAGILLFLRRRSLLIALGIINILPLLVFYIMWAGRPDVLWSLPGLMTKISQLLLEAGLVYLIITYKKGLVSERG
jgi:hypothetical protein